MELDGPDEDTIGRWVSAKSEISGNADTPPDSIQDFDLWLFHAADKDSGRVAALTL